MKDKRIDTIKSAILEAERFIKRARSAIDRLEQPVSYMQHTNKETGAVKRAAIDLKRELTLVNQMKTY